MTHNEWVNEGDVVLSEIEFSIFKELIAFREDHKELFNQWKQRKPSEVMQEDFKSIR
jgi:hypothetical protein